MAMVELKIMSQIIMENSRQEMYSLICLKVSNLFTKFKEEDSVSRIMVTYDNTENTKYRQIRTHLVHANCF